MSLIAPSLHSMTTGFTVEVSRPMLGLAATARRISASTQAATPKVLVSRIGVSSVPSSATCISPADFPKPLMTSTAARGFRRNGSPGCGRIAVTPGRDARPAQVAMPDRDAGHVGDRVAGARRHAVPDQVQLARRLHPLAPSS